MENLNIMVDVETTSLDPSTGRVIQIGAVAFDPYSPNRVFAPSKDFNMFVYPGYNTPWDPATLKFHEDIDSESWRYVMDMEACDPPSAPDGYGDETPYALKCFVSWIEDLQKSGEFGEVIMWAKPSHFDYNWIVKSFDRVKDQCDFNFPIHYRNVMDLRSFIAGLQAPEPLQIPEAMFEGTPHDALDDVRHQVAVVHKAVHRAAATPFIIDDGEY